MQTEQTETVDEQSPPANAEDNGPAVATQNEVAAPGAVSGGVVDDMRLAVTHNLAWLVAIRKGLERLFHYFFVGCVSLFALSVVFLIPLTIAVSVAAVLGLPGYLVYRLQGADGSFSVAAALVTIFWTGYFVTHGWPRLRRSLGDLWTRTRPSLAWVRKLVEGIADAREEDSPQPDGTTKKQTHDTRGADRE